MPRRCDRLTLVYAPNVNPSTRYLVAWYDGDAEARRFLQQQLCQPPQFRQLLRVQFLFIFHVEFHQRLGGANAAIDADKWLRTLQ
jgi:hypothetical protein